jgi:hypothetical protein
MDGVDALGIEQDSFGERGLTAVDVRGDPDVTDAREIGNHDIGSTGRIQPQGWAAGIFFGSGLSASEKFPAAGEQGSVFCGLVDRKYC